MRQGLARVVRSKREQLGLTQDSLAKLVGVSRSAINEIERGGTKQLKARNALRLAHALRMDPLELMDGRLDIHTDADPEQNVVRALEADPDLFEHSREVILAAYRKARGDGGASAASRHPPRLARPRRAARS